TSSITKRYRERPTQSVSAESITLAPLPIPQNGSTPPNPAGRCRFETLKHRSYLHEQAFTTNGSPARWGDPRYGRHHHPARPPQPGKSALEPILHRNGQSG